MLNYLNPHFKTKSLVNNQKSIFFKTSLPSRQKEPMFKMSISESELYMKLQNGASLQGKKVLNTFPTTFNIIQPRNIAKFCFYTCQMNT